MQDPSHWPRLLSSLKSASMPGEQVGRATAAWATWRTQQITQSVKLLDVKVVTPVNKTA